MRRLVSMLIGLGAAFVLIAGVTSLAVSNGERAQAQPGVAYVRESRGCEHNSDCPAPLNCLGGACGEQCIVDRDCGPGNKCEKHIFTKDIAGAWQNDLGVTTENDNSGRVYDPNRFQAHKVCVTANSHSPLADLSHSNAGITVAPAGAATPVDTSFEPGTNRAGSDYKSVPVKAEVGALACMNQCRSDTACKAWTYVNPGFQDAYPHCYLKNAIPPATKDTCCTSGKK